MRSSCLDKNMKYSDNEVASFCSHEALFPSVMNFCNLTKEYPFLLAPFRGKNEEVRELMNPLGFVLYPTVRKTTLFYEGTTDCFLKILHPLTLKYQVLSLFINRARSIYLLSLQLLSNNIRVPKILAYGLFKKGRKPFFVMNRIEGKSLNDILIKEKAVVPKEIYGKALEEVARLHTAGFWLGDAHLAHIFVSDAECSGFIDIDSIIKNSPFGLKNLAKDLAGLNNPGLPLTEHEKKELLGVYLDRIDVKDKGKFLQLIKHYTVRRWKAQAK
jgi:tRNA A-37 threonylcarbamoyl transferase component Bud32